jgi:predicted NodU family carbamoyl transferase
MNILGICGAFSKPDEEFLPNLPPWFFHDSAACLLSNGTLISAVEEERLNRLKHTLKFSLNSIHHTLQEARLTFQDLDKIAYCFLEKHLELSIAELQLSCPTHTKLKGKQLLLDLFTHYFDPNFDPNKLVFVKHHLAHAYSAYIDSGCNEALVFVIDGQGEKESLSLYDAKHNNLTLLNDISGSHSLGVFYAEAIKLLGYGFFDEYKVMGLAPYGDPAIYRHIFDTLYLLKSQGSYELKRQKVRQFLEAGFIPRQKGEPFNQAHKDFAAGLQEMLEKIVFHILAHWKDATGHKNLCIAGGVGHNCTLNGLLAYSGMFQKIFVHPAAHDSGAALGAAMAVSAELGVTPKTTKRITDVYWGPDIGNPTSIEQELKQWNPYLSYKKQTNIASTAAALMAEGKVIGWVQGKMEFGPRALGNRSILADPRPAENKNRINAMVKKREGYRPFAPSVLEEYVSEYFELPQCDINLDFMVFNLKIKKEKQPLLGAITHVNGTGRVQTVSKKSNLKYWNLIHSFQEITGIPMLLNTSFNNRAEPIVCSVFDAITCFLTTGLDYLVIDEYLIEKTTDPAQMVLDLNLSLAPTAYLKLEHFPCAKEIYAIAFNHGSKNNRTISKITYDYLYASLEPPFDQHKRVLTQELINLWSDRYLVAHPQQRNKQKNLIDENLEKLQPMC